MTVNRTVDDQPSQPICIVDDDPAVRESLGVLLEALGFEVIACAAAVDFLAHERNRDVSCLIVDLHMPGMGGLDMMETMQSRSLDVPTILVTGRLDASAAARAAALGVTAILEKPFATAQLLESVCANLNRLP